MKEFFEKNFSSIFNHIVEIGYFYQVGCQVDTFLLMATTPHGNQVESSAIAHLIALDFLYNFYFDHVCKFSFQ